MDVDQYLRGALHFIEATRREMHGHRPDRLAVNPADYSDLLDWAQRMHGVAMSPEFIMPGINDFDALFGIPLIVDADLAHGAVRCDYRNRGMADAVAMLEGVTGFHVTQWQRNWLTRWYDGIGRCDIVPADDAVTWTSRRMDTPRILNSPNENQDGGTWQIDAAFEWTIGDIERLRDAQWRTSVPVTSGSIEAMAEAQRRWNAGRLSLDQMQNQMRRTDAEMRELFDEVTRSESPLTPEEFETRRHELGGELRNPEANVLDEIDRLVDEELTMRQDNYNDPYMAECPRCHGTWHGFERAGCPGETGAKPTVASVPFNHLADEMRSAPTESVDVTGRGFPPLIRVYDENFREIPADQLGPEWVDIGCIEENGVR